MSEGLITLCTNALIVRTLGVHVLLFVFLLILNPSTRLRARNTQKCNVWTGYQIRLNRQGFQ